MSRVEVVVGIIKNHRGEILIGQRIVEDDYYQKWEFPGGKVETNEQFHGALCRELKEEVGIDVLETSAFMHLNFDYPDREVSLNVLLVSKYNGLPKPCEGQAIQWIDINKIEAIDMLAGNKKIIEKIKSTNYDKK